MRELEPVLDEPQRQHAQHGAEHRPASTEEVGAAEHHRRDDGQLEVHALVRRAAPQPHGHEHARERRGHADQREDGEPDEPHVDARPPQRLPVAAETGHVLAERGLGEHHPAHDRDDDRDHRLGGHPRDPPLPEEPDPALLGDRDRVAVGDPQRGAADDPEHRERDDERRNALVVGEPAVDGPDHRAEQEHREEREGRVDPRRDQDAEQRPRQGQHRADRQVDPARRDHERHQHGDDQRRAVLPQHAEQVLDGEERVGGGREHEEHHQQHRADSDGLDVGAEERVRARRPRRHHPIAHDHAASPCPTICATSSSRLVVVA
jgi:hypothetical protein